VIQQQVLIGHKTIQAIWGINVDSGHKSNQYSHLWRGLTLDDKVNSLIAMSFELRKIGYYFHVFYKNNVLVYTTLTPHISNLKLAGNWALFSTKILNTSN
jgi:hypothetical protein